MDDIVLNKAATIERCLRRNIAVHDDQKLRLEIVRAIIERHLGGLRGFARHALAIGPDGGGRRAALRHSWMTRHIRPRARPTATPSSDV